MKKIKKFTVDELMDNADQLHVMGQYRAAVMEAFTALEERVAEVVFDQLEQQAKLPKELVSWLKDKSKFEFEKRLHPIGAYALGRPIDKDSVLWQNYKEARKIRNDVSHTSRVVKKSDAEKVLATVRAWLEFVQGAKEDPEGFHNSEVKKEFLTLYAIFFSRFTAMRLTLKPSRPSHRDLIKKGPFSSDEKAALDQVISIRNKIAHAQDLSQVELQPSIDVLKNLISANKGREF